MRHFYLILLLFSVTAFSQMQTDDENSKLLLLNDSARVLIHRQDYGKAVKILNKAIKVDSNCESCYSNLVIAYIALKQYSIALQKANNLTKIDSCNHKYYTTCGMLHYIMNDSIAANEFYNKALNIINSNLDNSRQRAEKYDELLASKALVLILLGNDKEGDQLIKEVEDQQKKHPWNVAIFPRFTNKTKTEIITDLFRNHL